MDFYDQDVEDIKLQIELPNVEIFSISNLTSEWTPFYYRDDDGYRTVSGDYFSEIIGMLKLPSLKDFRVALRFRGDVFFPRAWSTFSRTSKSITSFAFDVCRMTSDRKDGEGWSLDLSTLHLSTFFEYFPALQNLSIDAGGCSVDYYGLIHNPHSLVSFSIKDFGKRRDGVPGILRTLVRNGAPLKHVDICSPYGFDAEAIAKIVPGAEIYFRIEESDVEF